MNQYKNIKIGSYVKITQQIPHPDGGWDSSVEGTVQKVRQAKTGSWFAHSHDDKLWLDRVELQTKDGEIIILNLDQYTFIEIL